MAAMSDLVVADRLERLAHLLRTGQASDLMSRTLDKLISHEAEVSLTQLKQLQTDLAEFEGAYGMTSDEFFHRYQTGLTDDRMEFVEWASLIQMTLKLRQRMEALTSVEEL
jgi:hypothetical protein